MPLLRSATRPQAVECFFCLSPSVLPPLAQTGSSTDRKGKGRAIAEVGTKWNWKCGRCQCWNVRDERGEMLSDHPAMHDPAFNTRSFALRATPSTSHLPSASHSSAKMFCHSCLANQTLIMNMLANYLPDDNDPSYPELHAGLPSYLASLHGRYPPVCPLCQPAVDEALRKADQKAQVEAWGSALRRGQNRGSEPGEGGRVGKWEILVWRARGLGFWVSAVVSWGVGVACVAAPTRTARLLESLGSANLALLALQLMSVLWFAWDPFWLRRRREHHRGRVKGRGIWVRSMLVVLISRLVVSSLIASSRLRDLLPFDWIARVSLFVEMIAFLLAFASLRSPRPVALRLIRPTQLSVPSTPTYPTSAGAPPIRYPHESHPYQSYPQSLSAPAHHPVFGKTSLSPRPSLSRLRESDMEWEPTPPPALYNGGYTSSGPLRGSETDNEFGEYSKGGEWDSFAVGKQRLFGQKEGEDETGLERLLAGWGLADQVGGHGSGTGRGKGGWGTGALRWFKGERVKAE